MQSARSIGLQTQRASVPLDRDEAQRWVLSVDDPGRPRCRRGPPVLRILELGDAPLSRSGATTRPDGRTSRLSDRGVHAVAPGAMESPLDDEPAGGH